MSYRIIISLLIASGFFYNNYAFAKCRVSLPFKDWSRYRSAGVVEYICKNESCGSDKYLLRFSDEKLAPWGKSKKPQNFDPSRSSLRFDGLAGLRIADSHGRQSHIAESYSGPDRMMGFYSEGPSRAQVKKNFKLLKSSAKC